MSTPSYIDLELDGPIATLVLNRPEKLNAWSWESARQIAAHADALRFRDDVRVVIVRAEGRSFCAGVDLGMPEDRITRPLAGREDAQLLRALPLGARALPRAREPAAARLDGDPRPLPRRRASRSR